MGDPKGMLRECKTQKQLQLLLRTPRELPGKQGAPPGAVDTDPKGLSNAATRHDATPALALPGIAPKPHEFTINLDMRNQRFLGLDVDWTDGKTLYIKSVQSGAMQDWNRVCSPEQVV